MQSPEQKALLDINHTRRSGGSWRDEAHEMDHSYGQQTGGYNVGPTGSDASTAHNTNTNYSQSQVIDDSYVENGLHPVPEPDKIVGASYYHQYNQVPGNGMSSHPQEQAASKRRICGMSSVMFMLWCILGFLLALLAIVAGVFGSMLARQSSEILDLKDVAATKTTDPDTNGTSTTAAPATTTTWVQVVDWEYIGCYEDTSNRVFPDKFTQIDDQTNRLCAGVCSGYEYFGTEFGDQCYCSRTPPTTAAPAWNCDMHCTGAQTSEICGGFFFLSAWKKKV
ncbi:hypothetical protein CLIM01_05660 [Colletotrichum limetticola]|uniref:WSC domain-containing protein n=1 Tax=Colletotrichum limetticola TaxID=1209924 RepID=A0ABQ9PZM5_9PEZI|nr:hypothetical protein CLIM01_05660 [Colletotrichum limetticola]